MNKFLFYLFNNRIVRYLFTFRRRCYWCQYYDLRGFKPFCIIFRNICAYEDKMAKTCKFYKEG